MKTLFKYIEGMHKKINKNESCADSTSQLSDCQNSKIFIPYSINKAAEKEVF